MKKNGHAIKTIWFDLGNVILDFDFGPAYRKLTRYTDRSAAEIERYFLSNPALEHDLDEGRVPGQALYRRLVRDLGIRGLAFRDFKAIWNKIFEPNADMVRLLGRLHKNGYRLILISNTNHLHYDHVARRYPFLKKYFHRHILSYKLKVRKPKPGIYERALAVSGAGPEEIYYTDDRCEMTDAAGKGHGVHCHTFRGFGGLVRDLARRGVRAD